MVSCRSGEGHEITGNIGGSENTLTNTSGYFPSIPVVVSASHYCLQEETGLTTMPVSGVVSLIRGPGRYGVAKLEKKTDIVVSWTRLSQSGMCIRK